VTFYSSPAALDSIQTPQLAGSVVRDQSAGCFVRIACTIRQPVFESGGFVSGSGDFLDVRGPGAMVLGSMRTPLVVRIHWRRCSWCHLWHSRPLSNVPDVRGGGILSVVVDDLAFVI